MSHTNFTDFGATAISVVVGDYSLVTQTRIDKSGQVRTLDDASVDACCVFTVTVGASQRSKEHDAFYIKCFFLESITQVLLSTYNGMDQTLRFDIPFTHMKACVDGFRALHVNSLWVFVFPRQWVALPLHPNGPLPALNNVGTLPVHGTWAKQTMLKGMHKLN